MTGAAAADDGRRGGRRRGEGARSRLSRLPLRVRLVAGFAAAITVVLAGAGAFVYWRVSYALDLRLDQDLRAEAGALAPLVTGDGRLRADPGLDRTAGARQYQVLAADGSVLAHGSEVGPGALLSPDQARAALSGEVVADVGALLPRSARPLRLLAVPLPVPPTAPGPARVLMVADRRDERDEALRELLAQLLVAGFAALVVSTLVGERLARAALAPVERYRARAVSIAGGARGVRLDVPAGRDDEVTRLGHTLNAVLDALEHAVDAERRFIQDASHELRTPLTLLSTRVQLALRRPRTAVEHEATLRELGRDVDALAALAGQLLQISTGDAGSGAGGSRGEGCDLTAVARAVSGEHAAGTGSVRTGRVVFHAALDAGRLPVGMPDTRLRQVLGNLLANAATHGDGDVHVRVHRAPLPALPGPAVPPGLPVPPGQPVPPCVPVPPGPPDPTGVAVLTVTDDGPGVDPGFLPAAVDRFARADVARSRPGAGLGLSLVHGLLQLHGGELRLCSRGSHQRYAEVLPVPCAHPATGTTATVLLPLAQPGTGP